MCSLFVDPNVSYRRRLERAFITRVLEPLVQILYVIAQAGLGCETLPTVRAAMVLSTLVNQIDMT